MDCKIMPSILKHVLLTPIYLYRLLISPLYQPTCRYIPSCSEYAKDALKYHGLKGVLMTIKRLVRCHPWSKHALYDPVEKSIPSERH